MLPPTLAAQRLSARRLAANAAAFLLLVAVIGLAGLAFAWPWLPQPPPGGEALARYAPVRDGGALLYGRHDARGETYAWLSENFVVIPALRVFTDLRAAQRDALTKFYAPGVVTDTDTSALSPRLAAARAQIFERRDREVDAVGGVTETVSLYLREGGGEFLVGFYYPQSDRDSLFDPPVLTFPADLHAGSAWHSMGSLGVLRYEYQAHAAQSLAQAGDCLQVDDEFILTSTVSTNHTTGSSWLCAGAGAVESQSFDASRRLIARDVVIAGEQALPAAGALPPPVTTTVPGGPPALSPDWKLLSVARALESGKADNSTIAPVWIPTNPPLLLAAGYNGDLVAFKAGDAPGEVEWRFHPGGNIYGQPAFDPQRSRIYFGATDKRLYALDARGIFLWSFATGDNVAGRPLVVSDTIVFGSEDRNIYALDAQTGTQRWSVGTGGAVVSSPARYGDTVIVGSDDGGVYALALANGAQRWLYTAKRAVEAAVVVSGDSVYVASRDGMLAAVSAQSGDELWSYAVNDTLRTAPAVDDTHVYAVGTGGTLTAVKRADGKLAWQSAAPPYAGSPLLSGDSLIVAGKDGKVYQVGRDGVSRATWSDSGRSPFEYGPVAGGAAVWLADGSAAIWRLGSAPPNSLVMRLSWTDEFQRAPFASEYLSYGPAAWQGQALVVDSARNIYLVDPATGSAVKRGTVPGKGVPLGGPVAAGDLLLLAEGTTLHATRLTDGGNAWEFNAQEIGYLPAAVERNMVLWVTQSAVDSLHNPGTLHALDRATGALRWEVSVSGLGAMGGMAVRDGVAYLSTPPSAYDVATGKLLWEADVRGISYGGVALNAAGDTLFVAAVSANLSDGLIVALDSSNGNERWRQALKGEYLDLLFESVLLDGQTLVVPLATHALVGLDAANGTQRWRYAPPQPLAGRVTVGEGHVFLSLQNGHVVALDTPSGTVAGVSRDFETNLNSLQARPRALLLAGRLIVPLTSRLIGYTLER